VSDYYEANPMSIEKIRDFASAVRRILGIRVDEPIDFEYHLDLLSLKFAEANFNYIVVPDGHGHFSEKIEAYTNTKTGDIFIKESVYKELKIPNSRSNFTVAHEVGHYFLHHLLGAVLPRGTKPEKVYLNPEWQADQFAAEYLMPLKGIKNLTIDELTDDFLNAIPKGHLIAIGTYGFIKTVKEQNVWFEHINKIIEILKPKGIVVYGSLPKDFKSWLKLNNIKFKIYESYHSKRMREVMNNVNKRQK
jgi:hypothetical protein